MELFPRLELGWFNGWTFIIFFFAIFGILIKSCPKEVVSRLYDEEGWTKLQRIFTKLAKLCGVIHIILLFLTPLNIGSIEFMIGVILFLIGVIGFIVAIFNFKKAPLDKPINTGLYKISRNPQILMLFLVSLGSSLVIGSGIATIIVVISNIFLHFRILGEEKRLLEQYGESYEEFKKKVPRYFLFF